MAIKQLGKHKHLICWFVCDQNNVDDDDAPFFKQTLHYMAIHKLDTWLCLSNSKKNNIKQDSHTKSDFDIIIFLFRLMLSFLLHKIEFCMVIITKSQAIPLWFKSHICRKTGSVVCYINAIHLAFFFNLDSLE